MDQVFGSLLNLGSSIWLLRNLAPSDYGLFVLTVNVALIVSNLQSAATLAHLVTLPPGPADRAERAQPERMILAITLLMLCVIAVISAITVTIVDWHRVVVPVALAIYLPAIMLNAYTRSLAFSRGLVLIGMIQSGAVLLIATLLAGIASVVGIPVQVEMGLSILATAYGGVAFVTLLWLCRGLFRQLRLHDLLHFGMYAKESAWVLLGIGSMELLGRFNSIIVSVWFDTAAVAVLSATELLLRPVGVIIAAWAVVGRLEMVEQREAGNWPRFISTVVKNMGGAAVISTVWSLGVYFSWPLISTYLFGGRYAEDAWIVLLTALGTVTGVVLFVVNLGFQSLRRFRLLAYTDMVAALVSVGATMLFLELHFSYPMSRVGLMIGQLLDIVLLCVFLFRLQRKVV
jgi:O-antigen/teichoic acid export membrane protein